MTVKRWALCVLVATVLGALLLRGCYDSPAPQAEVQQAASNAASAIVAKAALDTAISQHRVDSVVRAAKIPARLQTKRHADSMETALRQQIAAASVDIPDAVPADTTQEAEEQLSAMHIIHEAKLAVALGSAKALIDTLHKQIGQLEADTASLGSDNRRLASAGQVASQRLTQDTVVSLPAAPPHKRLLGIFLPSLAQLKRLIPAVTVQKDLVRFDGGKPSVASLTSVSVGVGYTIRF